MSAHFYYSPFYFSPYQEYWWGLRRRQPVHVPPLRRKKRSPMVATEGRDGVAAFRTQELLRPGENSVNKALLWQKSSRKRRTQSFVSTFNMP